MDGGILALVAARTARRGGAGRYGAKDVNGEFRRVQSSSGGVPDVRASVEASVGYRGRQGRRSELRHALRTAPMAKSQLMPRRSRATMRTPAGAGIAWRDRYYPENISGKDWDDMPWSKPRGNDGDEAAGEDGSRKPADDSSDPDVSDDEQAKMKIMGKMGPSLWRNFDGLRLNVEGEEKPVYSRTYNPTGFRSGRTLSLDARTMLLRQRMYEKCYGDYARDVVGDNFQPRQYQGYKSMSLHVMRALKDFGATTCWVKPFQAPVLRLATRGRSPRWPATPGRPLRLETRQGLAASRLSES